MVNKNQAYKRKLAVADRLLKMEGYSESKRILAHSILDGSYRSGAGKGSRNYEGRRVDTYEGRIDAVTEILGLHSENDFNLLEKVILSNNYLSKTRSKKIEGLSRADILKTYIQNVSIKEIEKEKQNPVYAYREALGHAITSRNNKIMRNVFATGLAASLMISTLGTSIFGCSKNKTISSVQPTNVAVSQVKGSFPVSVLYPRLESPKDSLCYRGVKNKALKQEQNIVPMPELGKVVTVGKVSWHEIPETKRTTKLYYETSKAEPAKEELKVVQTETNKVIDAQIKPVGTNGLYRMHVDFRNLQSRDKDKDGLDEKVSASPVYFGKALKNEVVSFGEVVTDGKDLGYTQGKTGSRLKSLKDALKLGFTKENKEARKEYNPVLKTIMATYDGVQSIAKGAVDGADLVLGGLTDKVVYDVIGGGAKTLVNSTVDAGNFVFAVPLDASQRFENWAFKNKGKVSMETYELASTIMRFGGNVVLHEAPFDGKFVEVKNEKGEKVLINKGGKGATAESIVAVLLDAGVLSQIHSGGNGGSSKDGNSDGGSWSWNSSGSPGGDVGSFGSSGSGGGA